MKMERNTALMLMVVAIIFGTMNAIFGYSALRATDGVCPGEACQDARDMVMMGFGIAVVASAVAIWAFVQMRRAGR